MGRNGDKQERKRWQEGKSAGPGCEEKVEEERARVGSESTGERKEERDGKKGKSIPCRPGTPRLRHDSKGRLASARVSKCEDGEDANKEKEGKTTSFCKVHTESFPNRCWHATQVRQGRPARQLGMGQSYYRVR